MRARTAELVGVPPDDLAEALLTHYPPGATIGWHRDAPAFGEVVGSSLGSPCLLPFQQGKAAERRVHEQVLQPRSGYVLAGPVRTRWEHSIPGCRPGPLVDHLPDRPAGLVARRRTSRRP